MNKTETSLQQNRQSMVRAVSVGLFLFAVYLLCYRGGFHSVDEVSTFAVTESLVKFGQLNTDQIAWTQWTTTQAEVQGFFGADGHVYSKKGFALSLFQAPLYWLALVLPGIGMVQTVSLLNAILTAATGSLVFAVLRRLDFSEKPAIAVALIFGLATIAAVYANYMFSGTLAGFLLTASFYLLLRFKQRGGLWNAGWAGLLGGLTVLARANNLLLLGCLGVYLLAHLWNTQSPETRRTAWRKILAPLGVFAFGAALAGAILLWYNWARSGNPLQTGYDLTLFSPNILLGLYKLLFSPLRGLFIYSPVLILASPGWLQLKKTHPAEAWLIGSIIGITVLLFSAWSSGEGLSWGSRFLVPVVPLLAILVAPLFHSQFAIRNSPLKRASIILLIGLSALIQLLASAVNPWVYLGELQTKFGGEFFLEKTAALTDFSTSQIAGQLQNFSVQNSDLIWWQPGQFDAAGLGASLALVVFTGVMLQRGIANRRAIWGMALLTAIITVLLMARYYRTDTRQFGPLNGGYEQALARAAEQATPGDSIITVAQYSYHVPMNRFKAKIPLIGFAQTAKSLPLTALPLLNAATAHPAQQAWLVTQGWQPSAADNAAEAWLAQNAFVAVDAWLPDEVRLVRYGLPQPAENARFNVAVGNSITLVETARPVAVQPGDVLPVEFSWLAQSVPAENYTLFLQLIDINGALAAQHNGIPGGGYRPTASWAVGKPVIDRHGLALPAQLAPGDYRLIAGLFNPVTGSRLPVFSGGDFIDLGIVTCH